MTFVTRLAYIRHGLNLTLYEHLGQVVRERQIGWILWEANK